VGRAYRDPPLRVGMQPTAGNLTTREDDRVVFLAVEDGELKIAVKRRGRYRLPHETLLRLGGGGYFDLNQGI
jgi:hypothetical protein